MEDEAAENPTRRPSRRALAVASAVVILFVAVLAIIGSWRVRSVNEREQANYPLKAGVSILPNGMLMFAPNGTIANAALEWLDSTTSKKRYFELGGEQFIGREVVPVAPMQKRIRRAATMLNAYPRVRVEVIGHSNASTSRQSDTNLSRSRAQWVASRLEEGGVPSKRISFRGVGADRPIAPTGANVNERVGLLFSKD